MKSRKALLTGITGQDGHHLTKLLLSKNYEVHGLVSKERDHRYKSLTTNFPSAHLHDGDLADYSSLAKVINEVEPDEIYNLGALTFVGASFKNPEDTANVTGLGALRLLEAIRNSSVNNNIRFYQASSSEMYGLVQEVPQTERTPFHPRSPYAVAKTFSHFTTQNFREAYGMHASSGILFNHEGEYRGYEFVTRKITQNVARIKLGMQTRFSLGDLTPKRDWGYAGDYVEAMWQMLQQDTPGDFVIATGESHSVLEFVEASLQCADLNGDVTDYVDFDDSLVRPAEVPLLLGDSSKARKELGWVPKVDFIGLVELMVKNDLDIESKNR
ncbi:MAG: NAD-dependent epimerase/dehydratase family protein [Actinobacteria bacterium]|uniref:GDP-mannose 4,6-dehydratase n=1 Tax=freshwater metagenome TaxID=449393 RepID=A0A6J6BMN5_9ZZZZ|nr:NAD-dependent epimerase/dehydratase family protein [Actinomycetota bacterium]